MPRRVSPQVGHASNVVSNGLFTTDQQWIKYRTVMQTYSGYALNVPLGTGKQRVDAHAQLRLITVPFTGKTEPGWWNWYTQQT